MEKLYYDGELNNIPRNLKEMAKTVQQVLHKDVNIINCQGGVKDGKAGVCNIRLWSSRNPDNLEFPDVAVHNSIAYDGDVILMPDEDAKVGASKLIQYIDGDIYFLYNCLADMPSQLALRTLLIDEILEVIYPGQVEARRNSYVEAITEQRFKEIVAKSVQQIQKNKERDILYIKRTKERIDELRKEQRQLMSDMLGKEEYIKTHSDIIERAKDTFNREWEQMKANRKVERIEIVEDGLIEVITVPLYVKVDWSQIDCDAPTCRYLLGSYKFKINIFNGSVHIENMDEDNKRKSYWSDEDEHPHIGNGSDICYGNAGNLISACVDRMQWANLIDVVINFCESVNISDCAGVNVFNWDEVDENGSIIAHKYIPQGYDEDENYYYDDENLEWDEDENWMCPNCGTWNDEDDYECNSCDTYRNR